VKCSTWLDCNAQTVNAKCIASLLCRYPVDLHHVEARLTLVVTPDWLYGDHACNSKMSGYYQLPELEHMQQGSAEELEMRLLGRLQQVRRSRLCCGDRYPPHNPFDPTTESSSLRWQEALRRLRPVRLKLELQPVTAAPSSGNSRAQSFSGSHADYAAGHQSTASPAASPPKRTITGLHIRRKLALASKHPFGKLTSFGRRLDKRIETCQGTVLYEVRSAVSTSEDISQDCANVRFADH